MDVHIVFVVSIISMRCGNQTKHDVLKQNVEVLPFKVMQHTLWWNYQLQVLQSYHIKVL